MKSVTKYKIKERRERLNMSQKELSTKSGVCRATLSLLENNADIDIKVSTLSALAKALRCSPASLICPESLQE